MALSESYKNRMQELSGMKGTLTESARVNFLKNDFLERIGRKYDRFAKTFIEGKWDPHKEQDPLVRELADAGKFGSANLKPKDKFMKWAESIFAQLQENDPSENKQYLKWLSDIYLSNDLPEEDFYKIPETLTLFQKNKERLPVESRNANNFKSLADMYEVVLPYSKSEEMSASEKERVIKLEGAEQVFEDDRWKIIVPKTLDAACLYGRSTRWCTASPSNRMFDSYNKQGPLYVLIDKKEPNDRSSTKKLQFHFPSNQFMNTLDAPINVRDFFLTNPDLKEFFKHRKEITPAFEFEHKLLNKNELLKLMKTAEDKLQVISKKGFDFFEDLYIELKAKDDFIKTILEDQEFIKGIFEKEKNDINKLFTAYAKFGKAKQAVAALRKAPWLADWIMTRSNKKDIESFIIALFNLDENGKNFAIELCKPKGLIWQSCFASNSFANIGEYFNIISHRATFGQSGLALAKKLLSDPKIIQTIKDQGGSPKQIEMLKSFYAVMKESEQANIYYKNLFD
jgi:hypothetical protein